MPIKNNRPVTQAYSREEVRAVIDHYSAVAEFCGNPEETQSYKMVQMMCRLSFLEESIRNGNLVWKEQKK